MTNWLPRRDNLIDRQGEAWRPPLFTATNSVRGRCVAVLRRFLDLQAASIWNDLAVLLPSCGGSLLDVGCGAQPYRSLVPRDVKYAGIDTADAQQHFGYQVADTTYFPGETWPVADASVSNVLATETLEHVSRPERFLTEARRCLSPGGRLLLTVPFAARWHFIPHDYWRFTPSGLRQLLTEAGFAEIAVYARGNELTVACYKVVTLLLAWLFGTGGFVRRIISLLLSPLIVLLACIGQLSLRSRGGDDCLGYTVVALRSASFQLATGSQASELQAGSLHYGSEMP